MYVYTHTYMYIYVRVTHCASSPAERHRAKSCSAISGPGSSESAAERVSKSATAPEAEVLTQLYSSRRLCAPGTLPEVEVLRVLCAPKSFDFECPIIQTTTRLVETRSIS